MTITLLIKTKTSLPKNIRSKNGHLKKSHSFIIIEPPKNISSTCLTKSEHFHQFIKLLL